MAVITLIQWTVISLTLLTFADSALCKFISAVNSEIITFSVPMTFFLLLPFRFSYSIMQKNVVIYIISVILFQLAYLSFKWMWHFIFHIILKCKKQNKKKTVPGAARLQNLQKSIIKYKCLYDLFNIFQVFWNQTIA